jgi:Protein of unknown function (DUF2804)
VIVSDVLVDEGVRRHGRFAERPTTVNPLDEFSGLTRSLRRWRLKEWVGFTLVHPDWYSSFVIQDAQYLASSEIYAHDRGRGVTHQHEAVARGGRLGMPTELSGSRCAFRRGGYALEYELGRPDGRHRLRFDMAATKHAPAFVGELELDGEHASPDLAVSSQLPGGVMYTTKAIFPAHGVLRVGDDEIVFDGTRDLAILDEHKSFLPYRTSWVWGTFALHAEDGSDPGGLVGANLCQRATTPGHEDESCIWTPSACEPLADIRFEPTGTDSGAPWRITSGDGRVEVTFEPEGRKVVKQQFGVVSIDYFQMFGHYRGTVRGADRAYAIEGVHGVCESMRARL